MLDTESRADISISIQVKAKQAEIVPCEAIATITSSLKKTLKFLLCSTHRQQQPSINPPQINNSFYLIQDEHYGDPKSLFPACLRIETCIL